MVDYSWSWKPWWKPLMGVPQNLWFIREHPIKIDDLRVPPFMETSIWWLKHVWTSFTHNHTESVRYFHDSFSIGGFFESSFLGPKNQKKNHEFRGIFQSINDPLVNGGSGYPEPWQFFVFPAMNGGSGWELLRVFRKTTWYLKAKLFIGDIDMLSNWNLCFFPVM